MNVRIKFKSQKQAQHAARRMPCECHILHDMTSCVYLEFNERFYDYYYHNVKGSIY